MSARTFATDVLQQVLHVTELHEGENFHFGYQAEAGIDSLEMLGRELGFSVRVYTPANHSRQRHLLQHASASSSRRATSATSALSWAAASPS